MTAPSATSAATAQATVLAVLAAVGRLTPNQAARAAAVTPAQAGRLLEAAVQSGGAIKFQGAYWHPACPRRQARHRGLTADAYLALAGWPEALEVVPNPPGLAQPDLTLRVGGAHLLALEADTGTESSRQWREKAARYSAGGQGFDLVAAVAESPARAAHILKWWQGEPLAPPAMAWALADIPAAAPIFIPAAAVDPAAPALPLAPTAADWARWAGGRPWFHAYDGVLYLPTTGDPLIQQLHLTPLGRERRQAFDIWYWEIPSGSATAIVFPWRKQPR